MVNCKKKKKNWILLSAKWDGFGIVEPYEL